MLEFGWSENYIKDGCFLKKKITRLFILFVVFGISGISAVSASSSSIYASFSSSAKPVLSGVNGTIANPVLYTKSQLYVAQARIALGEDERFSNWITTVVNGTSTFASLGNTAGYQNLKLLSDVNKKIRKNEIYDALEKVNLFEDKDKLYYKYSLGMKQKLGLAQVLMEDPEVMILDEPFNEIENESVKKLREILLKEKSRGKIILIATHIREDISVLSDEIYEVDGTHVNRLI